MHFGLFSLTTQRDCSVCASQLYRELVERVKLAEVIGFDIAWFAEHHFSNCCLCPSPPALTMALAPQALPGIPQPPTLRSMDRFGADVVPMLERRLGGLATVGRPAG